MIVSTLKEIKYRPSLPAQKKIRQLYQKIAKERGRATLQLVLDEMVISHK